MPDEYYLYFNNGSRNRGKNLTFLKMLAEFSEDDNCRRITERESGKSIEHYSLDDTIKIRDDLFINKEITLYHLEDTEAILYAVLDEI